MFWSSLILYLEQMGSKFDEIYFDRLLLSRSVMEKYEMYFGEYLLCRFI